MKKDYYHNMIDSILSDESFENDKYYYNNDSKCLYGKYSTGYIFLAYIRDGSLFIELSHNSKKYLRHFLKSMDKRFYNLYFLDIQISYPNVRKCSNIFEEFDMIDVLITIFTNYIEYDFYKIFKKSNVNFIDYVINMCEKFEGGIDALFSKEVTKKINKLLAPKEKDGYEWRMYQGRSDIPLEYISDDYKNVDPKMFKRLYNINNVLNS